MGYRNNSSKPTCKSSPKSKHQNYKEVLRATLMDLNIETDYLKNQPHALVLKERANVFMTDVFKRFFFKMPIHN
jgi:hypothetical protein